MRRRLLKSLCAVVAGLLIAVGTMSWWLGAVLGWVGPRWLGVEFADYQRIGGGRVVLTDVVVVRAEARVEVSRIEADGPWGWLGAVVSGGRAGEVVVENWRVVLLAEDRTADSASAAEARGGAGWLPLKQRLNTVMAGLDWLPPVRAAGGTLVVSGREIAFGEARLDGGALRVESIEWAGRSAQSVELTRAEGEWTLAARGPGDGWSLQAASEGERINVAGTWSEQPWTLSASFGDVGWQPLRAQAEATDWVLPGARFGWEEAYGEIRGDARVTWAEERLEFSVEASGEPKEGAPELKVSLAGDGDRRELALRRATVTAPGMTATLDEPVRVSTEGKLLSDESKFLIEANLAEWPGLSARGMVSGRVSVKPGKGDEPEVDADLIAKALEVRGWTISGATARARLRWPELLVSEASVTLPGDEQVAVSGRYDLRTHVLKDGKASGRLTATTYGPWLPAGVRMGEVDFKVTAQGAWPRLEHGGELNFKELATGWLRPVKGRASWSGVGETADRVAVTFGIDGAELSAAGSVRAGTVDLGALTLREGDRVQWELEQPARLRWEPEPRVERLALAGEAGRVEASGDAAGFALKVEAMDSAWLKPWLVSAGPAWSLEQLSVVGAWSAGPLVMTLRGRVRLPLAGGEVAVADLDVGADADGIDLRTVSVGTGGRPVATAAGRLPLVIYPARAERWEWLPKGTLTLNASTDPAALFWERLAELSGLRLESPSIDIAVSGTWRKPVGSAHLRVARIVSDPERWSWTLPELENVNATLRGGADGLFLEGFAAEVAGQRVTAEGGLKAAPDQWLGLLREPARLAGAGGTLRLRIPDAEVAALARYMPGVLAPVGRFQLDLMLREGGGWDGFLKLTDAATRPLGPLGVLGDMHADIRLHDRSLQLSNVSARLGGQPVQLAGGVDLSDWRLPVPDLTLKGTNLPLVRRSGVLVRSDLDLRAGEDSATGRVKVTGAITLRDSLLLADLRSLLPGGGARGPARRPPYFSIDVPPVDAWGLDVALRGERFLRVRTPLFNGVLSARFHLGGTLGEPTLTGEVPVDQGVIKLPFASFTVEQGAVRLGASAPDDPRLRLSATGRSYGYNLRMELSGSASSPELTFSSTPPLSSEQVLLMVMAGETPSNEITYTTSQRAVRVGAYLGQSLLDTFGVGGGAADKLTINVGERISEQGRETYDVEYELTPKWSLAGEYNEFDDYNVGVKWRFYTSGPAGEKQQEADDAER